MNATMTTTTTDEIDALRAEFGRLARNARYGAAPAEWKAAVVAIASKLAGKGIEPTPEQWVEAARRATVECDQCHGSGEYCWGGTVNGVPVHRGPCYRCEGQGRQGQDDFTRNWAYDMHRKVI